MPRGKSTIIVTPPPLSLEKSPRVFGSKHSNTVVDFKNMTTMLADRENDARRQSIVMKPRLSFLSTLHVNKRGVEPVLERNEHSSGSESENTSSVITEEELDDINLKSPVSYRSKVSKRSMKSKRSNRSNLSNKHKKIKSRHNSTQCDEEVKLPSQPS